MPGKVNLQCEALTMVCAQVIVTMWQLLLRNARLRIECFQTVMAANFLQSARLLGDACMSFDEHCAQGLNQTTNVQRIG
jgi:fumarate hydratase class II